jgi:hypothetical protein
LETPILYLVFNRLEETKASFSIIREIKPKKLYVAADGHRNHIEGEKGVCQEVRSYILENIDWECELHTLFRDANLGCGKAVQGGLDWFFEKEKLGIILEDDILPDPSFFKYANSMLKQYEYDEKIFSINGCNLGYKNQDAAYGVTRYFNMWGWATWKRSNDLVKKSWSDYDRVQDFKPKSAIIRSLKLDTKWPLEEWYSLWITNFKNTHNGIIDTWDYQWTYTCLKNELFCIRPNVNLICNIGFNEKATHTLDMKSLVGNDLKVSKISIEENTDIVFEVDSVYEIMYVAEKWQNFKIDYRLLIEKIIKKLNKIFD